MYTVFYAPRVVLTSLARRLAARAAERSDVRRRAPLVLLVAGCVVATTAAVSGAGTSSAGAAFAQAGHWVASSDDDTVYHVVAGGSAPDVEVHLAEVRPGSVMAQSADSGFVIDSQQIRGIDKSSLTVQQTVATPTADEPAFPLEATGGPYAVYRDHGTVVRLGARPTTISTDGPVGDPVVTADGTLWLYHTGKGLLCHLAADAELVSCPLEAPQGHHGALTVVDDRVVFLDTTDDTLTHLDRDGLGRPRRIDVDLPPAVQVAGSDVDGRIAVLDHAGNRLYLVDAAGLDTGWSPAPTIPVPLKPGDYAAPLAGRSAVVLLDTRQHRVHTYDSTGRELADVPIAREDGRPRLSRGEDGRVYVDGGEGRNVQIVDDSGAVAKVALGGDPAGAGPTTARGAASGARLPQTPERPAASTSPPTVGPRTRPTPPSTAPPPRTRPPATPPPGTPPPGTPPRGAKPPSTDAPRPGRPSPDPTRPGDPGNGPGTGTPGTGRPGQGRPGPLPASPPGMPPDLRAVFTAGDVIVTWGAAADNGAAVTSYRVTWAPARSAGGALDQPGTARSATIGGLTRSVGYRITVTARNSAGPGTPSTVSITPAPRTVTVSRGETTRWEDDCLPPECAYIRTELRGFEPNTEYELVPWSSMWGNFNGGARLRTNNEGGLIAWDRFPYSGVGERVWVIVDGVYESNHFLWPAS